MEHISQIGSSLHNEERGNDDDDHGLCEYSWGQYVEGVQTKAIMYSHGARTVLISLHLHASCVTLQPCKIIVVCKRVHFPSGSSSNDDENKR